MKTLKQSVFLTMLLVAFSAHATYKPQPQNNMEQSIDTSSISKSVATGGRSSSFSQGGDASNGGININTPHQWPSGFATGFSQASNNGCRAGVGVNGGYGGVTIPWDDEDCELQGAAQLAYATGDVWGYCKLMAKTEAYKIAEISVNDCFARNGVSVNLVVAPSGKVTEPLQSYKDIQTPALDRLK